MNKSVRTALAASAALILVLLGAGCSNNHHREGDSRAAGDPPVPAGANVVIQWNNLLLQAIRDTKPGPPMTARALAIVHTCMYDAWAAYDKTANGTRFGGALRRPESEMTLGRKSKAVSFAAYRALVDLYPTEKAKFDAAMTQLGYDPTDASTDRTTPQGIGNVAAAATLAYCHLDGSNQLGDLNPGAGAYADYTGYAPMNPPVPVTSPTPLASIPYPGRWQPLTFVNQAGATVSPKFIAPQWKYVIPFAMTRSDQFRPIPPLAWNSLGAKAQVDEVIAIQAGLTDTQKCIAEYWADGPSSELPPGHFNLFGQFVSTRDHHTLDDDAKMFFALTNAISDAGIATWEAKVAYDYWRPVTAIRYLYNGQTIQGWKGPGLGVGPIDGAAWKPFQPDWFPTPPFAEYTSGHSAFSAAGAEILKRFSGSDIFGGSVTIPAHSLKAEPTVPASAVTLSWATFSAAADEAGISRIYGGIHFHDGDVRSRTMGRLCGTQAWEKAKAFWEGRMQPVRVAGE
ncbi:MAG: phosphatase PAP2 family protein [Holophagaceae bacterium]|nr:phosphatase PAP2 family protein [Holophagaceae bacterium]